MREEYTIQSNSFAKRTNKKFFKTLRIILFVVILAAGIVTGLIFFKKYTENNVSIKAIKLAWNDYDYQKVYELSKAFLGENPYNNTALTYYSYACFFIAFISINKGKRNINATYDGEEDFVQKK